MKSCGGSGDGAELRGIDGLIALVIAGRVRARNVRRERDVSNAIEGGEEICDRLEADAALAKFSASQDLGL